MGVGTTLKKILKRYNMTIKELSEKSGISLNTLYSITKRDSTRVDPVLLELIANTLEIPVGELIGLSDVEAFNALNDEGFDIGLAEITLKKYGMPTENIDACISEFSDNISHSLLSRDMSILKQLIGRLNDTGRSTAIERIKELSENPRYRRNCIPEK